MAAITPDLNVRLKSAEEIERLIAVGQASSEVLALLLDAVTPGVTGLEIEAYACELISERGYRPTFKEVPGYHYATCINVNDIIAHGIPSSYRFEEGDIVGIDVALTSLEGLVTDTAWSLLIGEGSPEAVSLIEGGQEALRNALTQCQIGKTTGDIGAAIGQVCEQRGFGTIEYLSGHGVGYQMHEDPPVPNFGTAGSGYPLAVGLVIAVEPMLTTGSGDILILDDEWSVVTADGRPSSLFELSLAITADGPRILTPAPRPLDLSGI